jgi:proliferating cell nuclear antigen
MFKAKVKAGVIKSIIDATATLVDEVKIHVTSDGWTLRAVDPAHVAMIDLSLGSKAFQEYKATEMDIGMDLDKFKDILKLAKPEDVLSLEFKENENRLVVSVGNLVRRMSLIDTAGMADPKVPNLNLPNIVKITAGELSQGIKASEAVSDHVALVADGSAFELIAEGDADTVNLKLVKNQLIDLKASERTKSLFSLDYFSNMVKACDGTSEVSLNLGSDYPVRMEFDFADGNGHVRYLLAPRIENE